MTKLIQVAALVLAVTAPLSLAHAATYQFAFSGVSDASFNGSGTFDTGLSGSTVQSITGSVNDGGTTLAITGLGTWLSPDFQFSPSAPYFTEYGISFVAGSNEYNLQLLGPDYFVTSDWGTSDLVSLTISPVAVPGPIAGSGALSLLVMAGFAFWRRSLRTA